GSPQGSVITPLTQKVISSSNEQLRDGEPGTRCLIFALRSNMFMTDDAFEQSGKGSAAERGAWSAPASSCAFRSSATVVTRVRFVRASSLSMAEPRPKSGSFQIHVSYSFDRLLEPKLAQAYDILVPCRERPVGVRVKEFDDEDGSDLRTGLVRAAARGEHDCQPDGIADRVRQQPRSRSTRRVGLRR